MKRKLLVLIALTLTTMIGSVNAASNPILNISGSAEPWSADANTVELADLGTVRQATGIFSDLIGGTVTNLASVIDLNLSTGDYSSSEIRVFDDFLGVSTTGITTLFSTYFLLNSVDDVVKTTTSNGQSLRVDTHLQAIIDGDDKGSFAFRWELSHNGNTGSYSVSTIISPVSEAISEVPVPAAVWLFGSSILGLAGFARRKNTVIKA